jgi:hypothetical protein
MINTLIKIPMIIGQRFQLQPWHGDNLLADTTLGTPPPPELAANAQALLPFQPADTAIFISPGAAIIPVPKAIFYFLIRHSAELTIMLAFCQIFDVQAHIFIFGLQNISNGAIL